MSTPRSRRSATLALLLALTAATATTTATTGCKKGAGAIDPDGGGGGGKVAGGTELRYGTAPAKLKADVKFSFKASGAMGVSEASGDLSGTLDIADAGGKLKVGLAVTEVRDLALGKDMLPPPKEGETPVDPRTAMQSFTGAFIADMRGELDEEATKALPETAALKDKKGVEAAVGGFASSVLGLPELPKPALVEGKPVETSERKDENLNGLKVPLDTTTKFTLVKMDASSGKRIAEIHYESTSSGAVEQGKQLIAVDIAAEGVVFFNVDDQLPVSRKQSSTMNISAGEMGFEVVNELEATFTPV